MSRNRKPFYANEMHNDSNFSMHNYLTSHDDKLSRSKLKQFVDMPCPFGIQNTYKYLRKVNLSKLPFLTQTSSPKKPKSLQKTLHTTISKRGESLTPHYTRTLQSITDSKKAQYIIKVCMFDQIQQVSHFSQYCIDIDLMKYIRNCFLKCKLHLESLTLEEYRQLQRWILPTLRHRKRKGRELESPLVLLGVIEMKTKEDLIQKLKLFDSEQKNIQIYQIIEHFFIPDDQIIKHQLQTIIQHINKIYKFKKIVNTNPVSTLFLLDGTPVDCLFQMTTKNLIVIGAPRNIKSEELKCLRESLKRQIKQQQRKARQIWMRSVVKADRSISSKREESSSKQRSYDDIDESLRKRRARQIKTTLKDKYFQSRSKTPFFIKDDLVREYDIFNI